MKNIMIIIDGMHDEKISELGNITPLEASKAKNIEYMKSNGSYGFFKTAPQGCSVDSLTCILTILGQDKNNIPSGRAYFEALAEGITLKDEEFIMRCNFISIDEEGHLDSSTGGNLTEEQYNGFFEKYTELLPQDRFQMYHMSAYKNLLIIKDDSVTKINDYPPHQNIGKLFKDLIPENKALEDFVLNGVKTLNEDEMKYGFLPWGLSKKETISSFTELHNIKSASVCHTEIVRGISIAMGMYTPKLEYATADIDTNLFEKAEMAIELIKEYEFVLIHVNGADEASHRKDPIGKTSFIKKIDNELIGSILSKINEEVNILITSDHSTLCNSGKHKGDAQPFVLFNKKINKHEDLGIIDGKLSVELMNNY